MRVLIAPDKFAGTLTAVQAAEAIAAGWREVAPDDHLDIAPLSDGGPGFVEVLHAAVGGRLITISASGPLGGPVTARLLRHRDTAYLEAAQACGLHLVPEGNRDPVRTTTYGVGELLAAAIDDGAPQCLLGLGGSATNDGGAGMLAALGARPAEVLSGGGLGLRRLRTADVAPARARTAGVELVMATDVDNPLLGEHGASVVFGPQKGASGEQVTALDAAMSNWAKLVGEDRADEPGAGAAGGLGFGLFVLGARRESGIDAVLRAVALDERVGAADLVLTGEGAFDSQSLRGKVPSGVARLAGERAVRCVVLAGRVAVGADEMASSGVDAAYSLTDSAGSAEAAMARPAAELASLAARVAREYRP